jgi:hypothetical protein
MDVDDKEYNISMRSITNLLLFFVQVLVSAYKFYDSYGDSYLETAEESNKSHLVNKSAVCV